MPKGRRVRDEVTEPIGGRSVEAVGCESPLAFLSARWEPSEGLKEKRGEMSLDLKSL